MKFSLWQILVAIILTAASLGLSAANLPEAMWAVMLFGGLWLVNQVESRSDREGVGDD